MILKRKNFENMRDTVRVEICCSIPMGTKTDKITEIETDTFRDWEKLEYVYIPPTIKMVRKDAFIWENIKVVFADLTKTKIEGIPQTVKVLPILGNEGALFSMLNEVAEIRKNLEFDPKIISDIDIKLRKLADGFISDSQALEEKMNVRQQEIQTILTKLEGYNNKATVIGQEILEQLRSLIDETLKKEVSLKTVELDDYYAKIKKELETLEILLDKCRDTESVLRNFEKEIDTSINLKKEELEKKNRNFNK